jgi:hypothetical protein
MEPKYKDVQEAAYSNTPFLENTGVSMNITCISAMPNFVQTSPKELRMQAYLVLCLSFPSILLSPPNTDSV